MKRSISSAVALLLVVALAGACGGEGGTATGTVTTTSSVLATTTTTSAPAPATTTSTTSRSAPLSASSRLRIDGIGPIDVGMTVEARAVAGTELSLKKEPYCDVLTAPRGAAGVALVLTTPSNGRVELVIVDEPSVATLSGIRVGSTEADVLATYPGRIRTVNPSLPVHRLIYTAADPGLADRALVFFVDTGRVVTMYAGLRNQAEADEICG